jgi:hypothetical protein
MGRGIPRICAMLAPSLPPNPGEGREPGERMGAEHQFLSTAEGELGGEARRQQGRGRGQAGDLWTRVLHREPGLHAAREWTTWVLHHRWLPWPSGWDMPTSTPRPAGRSHGGSRDGRRGLGNCEPRGGLLRASRRELRPEMLRPDCTSSDSKVVQQGRRIWPPRDALRRPEPRRRIHPCALALERARSTSTRRGGDPAAWAVGFAAGGER